MTMLFSPHARQWKGACAAVLAVFVCVAAHGQTTTAPKKSQAKPAPVVKPKPVVSRALAKKSGPVASAAPEAVAHLPLTAAQLSIAQLVQVGSIPCELKQVVEIKPMEGMAGFFKLHIGNFSYTLAPEETTTGAVRLEDKPNGIVWLQLINKSMLMNQKQGRRMADECMSPAQLLVAQEMLRNPPPSLLDALPVPAAPASSAQAATRAPAKAVQPQ